ncbi:MAG: CRISPR-associated helicase Cas3' [Bacteroidales bacterium]|jgi:CRISPR-associated endonuclease/helicase Cas3|nr:CRISPR-associated helicase Cas3' [Bacteroidales bacterium]
MKYDEILAKINPRKTLIEHTNDCLFWFPKVLEWNNAFIDKISEHYLVPKPDLIKRLFMTVAFHDIGKATERFQDKVRGIKKLLESHALASVPFIYNEIRDKPIKEIDKNPFYPEILAIASHHSKLKKNLFQDYQKMIFTFAKRDYFESFYQNINQQAETLNIPDWEKLNVIEKPFKENPYFVFFDNVLDYIGSYKYEKTNIVRDVFLLFKSVLHYCDWLASSNTVSYQYATTENTQSITNKMIEKNPHFIAWESFQLQAAKSSSKNIFVQIPTGQGKTEASVLWATQNNRNRKIVFLLPTMVTTNKMWERILFFFGGVDTVGLSHSTAQYVLKEKEEDIEPEELRSHYLYNRTFFKPITVATIDQLIFSFFNWGYWVLTGAASFNAKIIIDEIHIYDAYTFRLLLKVIEYIAPYNTQFAMMSASLPEILKQELEKVLPDYELIKEEKFDKKQRHRVEVYDCLIEQCVDSIIEDYNFKRKVLVVCNTIAKAREIFDLLNDEISLENRMLYHSQFILQDKTYKENLLEGIKDREGGFVAICTQIVEVSLDIDFDVLYTENAPIDAIIQRLGRVNRKGKIQERILDMQFAKVIITHESEKNRKYVYKDLPQILLLTYEYLLKLAVEKDGNIAEEDFKQLIDTIYTRKNLGNAYFKELDDARNLLSTIWKDYLKDIYTLNIDEAKLHQITSRKSDYITVEVVLLKHYQQCNFDECIIHNDYDLLRKYIIKVPVHIVEKYVCKKLNDSDIYLLDMKYSEFQGLSLESDDQNME